MSDKLIAEYDDENRQLRERLREVEALLFGVHKNGDALCCLEQDHVDAITAYFAREATP